MQLSFSSLAGLIVLLIGCFLTCPASAAGASDAKVLVQLRKEPERQAQAVRFMLAASPLGEISGLVECTIRKSEPQLREYYESLYAKELSREELRQAVAFFSGAEGQEAVRLRLAYEEEIFAAALKGQAVTETGPQYPAKVRAALDAFAKTAAGRHFAGPEQLEEREPYRGEVSDLRSAGLSQCLQEKAKLGEVR